MHRYDTPKISDDGTKIEWFPTPAEEIARMVAERIANDRDNKIKDALVAQGWTPPGGEVVDGTPWKRLAHIDQRTPVEKMTGDLVSEIETLGAHPLLTDAQSKVHEAMLLLGKWHDEGEPGGSNV